MAGTIERVCEVDGAGGLVTIGKKLVRCKDCKYFRETSLCCRYLDVFGGDEIALQVTPDGFCFWGVRR